MYVCMNVCMYVCIEEVGCIIYLYIYTIKAIYENRYIYRYTQYMYKYEYNYITLGYLR